jgi:hypothetical protein
MNASQAGAASGAGYIKRNLTLVFAMLAWVLGAEALASVDGTYDLLNVLTGLFIIIVSLIGFRGALVDDPLAVFTSLPWMYLTSAAYWGFGPLLYYFGTRETIEYADSFVPVVDRDVFRANMLNLGSTAIVVLTYIALSAMAAGRAAHRVTRFSQVRNEDEQCHRDAAVAVCFLVAGYSVRAAIILLASSRGDANSIPAVIRYFTEFSLFSLIIFSYLWRKGVSRYFPILVFNLAIEIVVSIASLSKLSILKVGVAVMLGMALAGDSLRRLAIIGAFGAILFGLVLVPFVNISRLAFGFGMTGAGQVGEAVSLYAGDGRYEAADLLPGVQGWWTRLNYANAQSFAMSAFDRQSPGSTFDLILVSFLPRGLFPDKPSIQSGADFNESINGSRESLSAPGMFAEGYWNAGYPGAFFVAVSLGVFYFFSAQYTRRNLTSGRLLFLPVVWLFVFTSIQQDSWFVAGTFGLLPIIVFFHFLLLLFEKSVRIFVKSR